MQGHSNIAFVFVDPSKCSAGTDIVVLLLGVSSTWLLTLAPLHILALLCPRAFLRLSYHRFGEVYVKTGDQNAALER